MARVKNELNAKDTTVSSISRYFEQLVADLTDKSQRDPKTKLMNFGRFTEQLESFLTLEQRGRWCAVGLVDITGFNAKDLHARFGGDEFCFLVPDLAEYRQAYIYLVRTRVVDGELVEMTDEESAAQPAQPAAHE